MNYINALRQLIYKSLLLLLVLVSSCGGGGGLNTSTGSQQTCTSIKYKAPSGEVNDITFTFDKAYSCGQFVNGDWWVSTDSKGNLTILSITPAEAAGLNGYEVNPTRIDTQSFDNRIPNVIYAPPIALPKSWSGTSSVIKAVSIPNPATVNNKTYLQYAAVLTILNAPLDNSAEYFRPNYFGSIGGKILFSVKDLQIPGFLARTQYTPDATALTQAALFRIEDIATRYQQVQMDHIEEHMGDKIHPVDNMPHYGADMATNGASSLLRMLLSDFDYSNTTHKLALINYLQWAIDLRAMAMGGRTWTPNGGVGQGRKLPLVFAGWIFNSAHFSTAISSSSFSEDTQVYMGRYQPLWGRLRGDSSPVTSTIPNPITLDYKYWLTAVVDGGYDIRDPYGYVDGGTFDIGGAYQFCCAVMPWKYTAMAIRMLGLVSNWNNNVFLIFVDRWTNVGSQGGPSPPSGLISEDDPCAPYPHIIGSGDWSGYGVTWGPDIANPGDCIKGGGPRWPGKHHINVNNGDRKNNFSEALFNWCRPNNKCN